MKHRRLKLVDKQYTKYIDIYAKGNITFQMYINGKAKITQNVVNHVVLTPEELLIVNRFIDEDKELFKEIKIE